MAASGALIAPHPTPQGRTHYLPEGRALVAIPPAATPWPPPVLGAALQSGAIRCRAAGGSRCIRAIRAEGFCRCPISAFQIRWLLQGLAGQSGIRAIRATEGQAGLWARPRARNRASLYLGC